MTHKEKLKAYMAGEINYTPLMNIFLNNRDEDWYSELGRYIEGSLPSRLAEGFPYLDEIKQEKKKNVIIRALNLGPLESLYSGLGIYFLTATLDRNTLKKLFGAPLLHSEFGEGLSSRGSKNSYASYFVNVGGIEMHIGYDHRGTLIEIQLKEEETPYDFSKERTEEIFGAIKHLVDLFIEKFSK